MTTLNPTQSERLDIRTDDGDEGEVCGAEMTDGSKCLRDPEECPYHG